jgi:hypothetical protein
VARLTVEASELVVRLSPLEKLATLRGDLRIPMRAVRSVRVEPDPWRLIRGVRGPGAGLYGVVSLGVRHYPGGKDFTAVYGRRPAVTVELNGSAPFRRLILTTAYPQSAPPLIAPAG